MRIFSSKIIQGISIISLFALFVVLPSIKPADLGFKIPYLHDYSSEMFFGIFHINSIGFVGLAALLLYLSIGKDVKKAKKLHQDKENGVKEAENALDEFFYETISLETLKEKSENNHIIKNTMHILKHGGIEEDLVLGSQKIYSNISSSYTKLKNDYEYLATVMPIIGMIGTIAGLLMMFAEPTQAEDFEKKFAGLSLALSTTLYASLITILIFKPNARSVEQWQTNLDHEFDSLEISIRKFYHKVNVIELMDLENSNAEENNDKSDINKNLENIEEKKDETKN